MADKKRVAVYNKDGQVIGWQYVDATETVATPVKSQAELDQKVKEQHEREAAEAKKPAISPLLAASQAARKRQEQATPTPTPKKEDR